MSSSWNPWTEPGQGEVETGTALGADRLLTGQVAADVDDAIRFRNRVGDASPAIGRREVEPVRHRAAPVGSHIQARQAVLDAEQAAQVPGVAVGVPARGVHDPEGLLEIVVAVEQREDDQAVIGNHVAVAAVDVIAVVFDERLPGFAPVGFAGVPRTNIADHGGHQDNPAS